MKELAWGAVPARVFPDAAPLGEELARYTLERISAARRKGRPFLLGCPSDRSLWGFWKALGRQAALQGESLAHLFLVLSADCLAAGAAERCPAEQPYSGQRVADEIRELLNAALPPSFQLQPERVWAPDPQDPGSFEERLAVSGVDLFLLTCGPEGRVAFNVAGTPLETVTRVLRLTESIRRDLSSTFSVPQDELPAQGISVGLGTIVEHSREVALVLEGEQRRQAAEQLAAAGRFEPALPASLIYRCRQPSVWVG